MGSSSGVNEEVDAAPFRAWLIENEVPTLPEPGVDTGLSQSMTVEPCDESNTGMGSN